MKPLQKFADIDYYKILQENICFSNCGSEVVYKIAQEIDGQYYRRFMTVDLYNGIIKLWSSNFEALMFSAQNPYSNPV